MLGALNFGDSELIYDLTQNLRVRLMWYSPDSLSVFSEAT